VALVLELAIASPPASIPRPLSADSLASGAPIRSAGAQRVSPCLSRLTSSAIGPALVAIPNGTGSADAYGALSSVLPNAIYAAMHPHLSAGLRSLDEGLEATSIELLADGWTDSILTECAREAISSYVLVGASLGGLLAHLVGLSAHRRGGSRGIANQGIVLIDPMPPVPLSRLPQPGVRGAATYLAMHGFDLDLTFLDEVADADLGMKLAARRAELGLVPFTEQSVLERQRELRAATHLLTLAASFQSEAAAIPPAVARVWLALSANRVDFFASNAGLSAEEAGRTTALRYGQIAREITVPGTHLEVCQRCMIGDLEAFNELLNLALSGGLIAG